MGGIIWSVDRGISLAVAVLFTYFTMRYFRRPSVNLKKRKVVTGTFFSTSAVIFKPPQISSPRVVHNIIYSYKLVCATTKFQRNDHFAVKFASFIISGLTFTKDYGRHVKLTVLRHFTSYRLHIIIHGFLVRGDSCTCISFN